MLRFRWLTAIALVAAAIPLAGCGHHKSNCCPAPTTSNAPCCPGTPPAGAVPPPPGPVAPF